MKNRNILLLLCMFMLFTKHTFSQNNDIDSLVNRLNYQPNDTNKVVLLRKIVYRFYQKSKFDSAANYCNRSLILSDSLKYQKGQQLAHFQQGYIYFRKALYKSAIYHTNQSLELSRKRKDKTIEAETLNLLGIINKSKGEYYKSIELYFEALKIWESLNKRTEQIIILNNIGLANYYLAKYETALKYYNASYKISIETDNTNGKSLYYNNCGLLFQKQKQYKKALDYYKKSLAIELQQNDTYGIPICYLNIGNIYKDTKKYSEALKYLDKSSKMSLKYGDIFGVANTYIAIANIYLLQKNYPKAKEYLIQSINKSTIIKSSDLKREAYKLLSDCFFEQKDYFNAYKNHKLYKEVNDSIFSVKKNKQILELHTIYETEKKEIENIVLKEKQKRNELIISREEAEINNQHLIILIISIILLFVIILSYFLHCVNKRKKLMNKELTIQNIEIKSQKEEIETQRNLLKKSEELLRQQNIKLRVSNNTKDKFFSIIAHDLRSPFNSLLGFSNILLVKHEEFNTKERKEAIININNAANKAYKLLEDLLIWSRYQLSAIKYCPSEINLDKILNKVIYLKEENAKEKNIQIIRDINTEIIYADSYMISTIFRNLISNAIKFTNRGGSITISSKINETYKATEFSVTDTGIGIAKERIDDLFCINKVISTKGTENESGTGLGLILCKEFIEEHRGKIWIESEIGQGSSFKFIIPNKTKSVNNKEELDKTTQR